MPVSVMVLSLGIIVLLCGSVALLTVRLCSPGLRGTAWLSGSFAVGASGAALQLAGHGFGLALLGADLAILTAFILLHAAVLQLFEEARGSLGVGVILALVQVAIDLLCARGVIPSQAHFVSLPWLVASQTALTSAVLWRHGRAKVHSSATFTAVILGLFTILDLLRGLSEVLHLDTRIHDRLRLGAFGLSLGAALGVGFGFLWMTTSRLTGELEQMASTDPLTRLLNRRIFLKWCEREVLRSTREGLTFSLLLIDLDHFKRVNDDYGHSTGDQVLCAAVEMMQDSVRGIDVLCRWGGEEFAVLVPNANLTATRVVAERIRENIRRVKLPLHAVAPEELHDSCLTASLGTATFRGGEDAIGAMLERADQALYQAKRAGRNCVLEAA